MSASVTAPLGVLKNARPLPESDVGVCSDRREACCRIARFAADSVVSIGALVAPIAWLASAARTGTATSSDATSTYAPRARHLLDRLTSTSLTVLQTCAMKF